MASQISREQRTNAQDVRDAQDSVRQQTKQVREEGQREVQKAREGTREVLAKEHESSVAAVNHVRTKGAEAVAQARREVDQKKTYSQKEMAEARRRSDAEVKTQRDRNRANYEHEVAAGDDQYKRQTDVHAQRLENERKDFVARQSDLRERGHQALQDQSDESASRLTELSRRNAEGIDRERDRGRDGVRKTGEYYSKQIQSIHKEGDAKVAGEKYTFDERLKLQKDEAKHELEQTRAAHQEDMAKEDATNRARLHANQQYYKQSLIQQKEDAIRAENKSREDLGLAIRDQKERFQESLVREKGEALRDIGRYSSRRSDPFYRLMQVNGRLTEHDRYYELTAEVPEHEKKNVQIMVRENQIVIQGHRSYQESMKRDGGELSTESYQTFREEIPLEHPVREKFVRQSYADGVLTVRVPKA